MKKLKLLYVHGLMGHGNGSASKLIRAELDRRGVDYTLDAPEFPVTDPENMVKMYHRLYDENQYDCIIASSLGAFYSMQLCAPFLIMVNPAMPENLREIREKKKADGENDVHLSDEFIGKLEKMLDHYLNFALDGELAYLTYFIFGERDTVARNEAYFKSLIFYPDHFFKVDMEHKLDSAGAEKVCDILEKIFVQAE